MQMNAIRNWNILTWPARLKAVEQKTDELERRVAVLEGDVPVVRRVADRTEAKLHQELGRLKQLEISLADLAQALADHFREDDLRRLKGKLKTVRHQTTRIENELAKRA